MKITDLHKLDTELGKTTQSLSTFHNMSHCPYWVSIHEIMDDCWRLQNRVREDMREKEKKNVEKN